MLTNIQIYWYMKYEILTTHMKEKYTHTGPASLQGLARSEQCLHTDTRNMNAEIYMHINKET